MNAGDRRAVIDGLVEIAPKWGGRFRQWKENGKQVYGIVDTRNNRIEYLIRVYEG